MTLEEFRAFIKGHLESFIEDNEDIDEELTEDEWIERFKESF